MCDLLYLTSYLRPEWATAAAGFFSPPAGLPPNPVPIVRSSAETGFRRHGGAPPRTGGGRAVARGSGRVVWFCGCHLAFLSFDFLHDGRYRLPPCHYSCSYHTWWHWLLRSPHSRLKFIIHAAFHSHLSISYHPIGLPCIELAAVCCSPPCFIQSFGASSQFSAVAKYTQTQI